MERPERLSLQSANGAQLNLDALYQIAPSCFTEGRDPKTGKIKRVINFDVLRQLLGDDTVEDATEAYEFNWVGKQEARAEVLRPISKTLRPVKEDSVDWDNTQNLYIEGDNLEVLKLLQKSYLGKVKMIYIDPPYNTGNDFVYHDDFAQSQSEYDAASGAVDELGNRYWKNTDSNGKYHSDWCSMIYSRLMAARSLLTEDGVIFISIDDNEQRNLKNICDEVFGESNWLITIAVNRTSEVATDKTIQKHEYCLVYAKSINDIGMCGKKQYTTSRGTVGNVDQTMPEITFPKGLKCINIEDGTYYSSRQIKDSRENIEVLSPFVVRDGRLAEDVVLKARWRSSNDMRNFFANKCKPTQAKINGIIEEIYFDGDRFMPYIKKLVTEKIPSLYLENRRGSTDLEALNLNYFDFPKSVYTISRFISLVTTNNDIVLDFFSGSATTAHATMQLNAEDRGNRKFIMVQLPEETSEDSEAYKAGYKNICQIGKERIRRAGKKIKEESPLTTQDLDTGFRVFRVDESNFEDVERTPKEYHQDQLDLFLNNVKSDRDDLDLLFGCMLDWGVQLSLPMSSEEVDGKMIYTVNDGDLVACFAEKVTDSVVRAMADKQPLRVIFRDSCFAQDADKINIYETFKQLLDWSDKDVEKNIRVI